MDPKLQTSFIPRRPVLPGGMASAPRSSANPLSIIAGIIFVVVLLISVGAFFYERSLIASNEQKKQEIQTEIASFDPQLSSELTLLKSRIDSASDLLRNHVALTEFFGLLQTNTISTVRFTGFSYSIKGEETLTLELAGEADNYNDIVLQSDAFLASPFLKNTIFSGFTLDELGKVSFLVKAEIDPSLISYQKAHERLSALVPAASAPVAPTASSTAMTATSSGVTSSSTNPLP